MIWQNFKNWIAEDDDEPLDWEEFRAGRLVLVNMAIYLAASIQFGASWWKCIIISIVVGFATAWDYGHRSLSRLGVVLLVLTLGMWSGVIPPTEYWKSAISSVIGCALP